MTFLQNVTVLLLVTVALGFAGSWVYVEGRHQERLSRKYGAPAADTDPLLQRIRGAVDRWGRTSPTGIKVVRRLRRAGLQTHPLDAFGIALAVIGIAGLLGAWALGPLAGGLAVVLAVLALRSLVDALTNRRRDQFIAQLPQVARLLANGSSAGLSVRQSLVTTCLEVAEPAKGELTTVADAVAIGVPLERALADLDERLPSRELSVLVKTLIIQVRSGGAVVTALQRMSRTLDARKKLRAEMKTTLAAALYVAYLLPVIGLLGLVVVTGGDRDTLRLLFVKPLGQIALLIALALGGTGIYLSRRSARKALG